MDEKIYSCAFNREIGRLFHDSEISAWALLNPIYNKEKKQTESPLILKLWERFGELNILNVGCGGCGDIPLFEEEIRKLIGKNPGERLSITNIDKDSELITHLKEGSLPCFDYPSITWKEDPYIKDYIKKCFIPSGNYKIGATGWHMKHINVEGYIMKKEFLEKLDVASVDFLDSKYEKNSFNLVLIHNVLLHFNEDEKRLAVKKVREVLKKDGILFPNWGLYKKKINGFKKVSDPGEVSFFLERGGKNKQILEGTHIDYGDRYWINYDKYII